MGGNDRNDVTTGGELAIVDIGKKEPRRRGLLRGFQIERVQALE